jgi:anti-sigma-K factor RskA
VTIDDDILVAYALGTLSPAEAREVERHLEAQPEAAATVLGYLDALSEMVMELPPAPLPEGAEEALLAGIQGRPPEGSAWRWGLGLGMAAKAGAALWLLGHTPPYEVRKQLDDYGSRPGAVEAPLVDVHGHIVGDFVRLPDNRLFVAFDRLPTEGRAFQAWEVVGGVPEPLGTWQGHTSFTERPLAPGSTFAVSLEPPGGSPQPTGEPLVLIPL